jgi:hypothetical protein
MKFLPKIFRIRNIFLYIIYVTNFSFSQFQVSPMLIEQYTDNDETSVSIVNISNNKKSQLDLKIYLKDRAYINGIQTEALPGTFERSCADWIFFTPSKLSLGPKETKSIRINMEVPDSAVGTYWSTLYIEESSAPTPRIAEFKGHKINLNVNMRMGVLITETVPGTTIKDGMVESISISYNTFDLNESILKDDRTISMLESLNKPEVIRNWIYIQRDDFIAEFERINVPENISNKLGYTSIATPKGLIKVLSKVIAWKENLINDEGDVVDKDYVQLIRKLYFTIKQLESKISDKKNAFINFSYYNSGNAISKCTGWIEFRDIYGLTVKRVEMEEILKIYPMERRDFQIIIPNDLASGEYSALAIVDYGGAQLVAGEITFEYEKPN